MPVRTGVDLVSIPRMKRLLVKYGESFRRRFFTGPEREHARGHREPPCVFSLCWGMREAGYKVAGGHLWTDYRVEFLRGTPSLTPAETLYNRPSVRVPRRARWDSSFTRLEERVLVTVVVMWTSNGGG